tara:strand:- start:7969 stop:8256 length:288 start_codon:yes stop_codon:yes gene_type:complete
MLKSTLLSALLLIGFTAHADNQLEKSNIDKLFIMKDNVVFFKMKDDSYYRGDFITPSICQKKGKISMDNTIHNSFRILHNQGFETCKFRNLERVA